MRSRYFAEFFFLSARAPWAVTPDPRRASRPQTAPPIAEGDPGVHAAVFSALIRALRRPLVGLCGCTESEDSFPLTDGELADLPSGAKSNI